MLSTDVDEFEAVLDSCVHSWGIDSTIEHIIIPFLEKVKILSYNDSSSEVHFAVTAIRKKIITGIEKAGPLAAMQKSALLFLPEGEHYDLILLYMTYVIKVYGLKVLYMGTNISNENVATIVNAKKPDFLFTYIPPKLKFKVNELVVCLDKQLLQTKLFVAGCGTLLHEKENSSTVQYIHYREVVNALKETISSKHELSQRSGFNALSPVS